ARVDVGARRIDRKGDAADIADLGQILDINAVIRKFGADRIEIFALRPERRLEPRPGLDLQFLHRIPARGVLGRPEGTGERSQRLLRIGNDANRWPDDAGDLDRIEVDADDLEVAIEPPAGLRLVEPRADREHDIDATPQVMAGQEVLRQVMAVADNALAPGI